VRPQTFNAAPWQLTRHEDTESRHVKDY
jgi:hypothetical protein